MTPNYPRPQADDIKEHLWYNAVLPPEEQAYILDLLTRIPPP